MLNGHSKVSEFKRSVRPEAAHFAPGESDEVRRLATLVEVGRALSNALDLQGALVDSLQILEAHPSLLAAALVLTGNSASFSVTAAGIGPGMEESENQLIMASRELVGRVISSGRPITVPRVTLEPMFRRRSRKAESESSFLAVPVLGRGQVAGCLLVELRFMEERRFDRALRFLEVVAASVGQAVKVASLVESEREGLMEENLHLREELKERYDFSNIIGNSRPMREVYERITQVARANTTVLIRGESGTGKELIAHAIHYNSLRSANPFVGVSCAALPETLVESELFGYEKGAFTGAQQRKKGRFELAEKGTLFLDEIGELQPALQVKLLRVLQERTFERVGGVETVRSDVRLIAATNKPLEEAILDGSFREDLYYRLNVFTVFVPPLRERKSDILLLADHFLEKYSSLHGKAIKRISTPAIDMLASYHWPGNVRELENAMERAVLVCDGHVIHGHHLPPTLQTAEASGTVMSVDLNRAVEGFERGLIIDALKSSQGNRAQAARLLNTTERIIGYKVRKYGLDCASYR